MELARLKDFDALTFDCYGTLIDWESGMVAGLAPLIDQLDPRPSRDQILEAHAFHEFDATAPDAGQGLQRSARDRLSAHRRILGTDADVGGSRRPTDSRCRTGRHLATAPLRSDYLKQHYKLVILSNVDNTSFAGANARLGVAFDAIYTAEDIGSYKPDRPQLRLHDHPARRAGHAKSTAFSMSPKACSTITCPPPGTALATCWIYRRHDQDGFGATMDPGERPQVDFRFNSHGRPWLTPSRPNLPTDDVSPNDL